MMYLREDWQTPTYVSVRGGFGEGLVETAQQDDRVVALSADLVGSVGFGKFAISVRRDSLKLVWRNRT